MQVAVLNRGRNGAERALPDGVESLVGDITDPTSLAALGDRTCDAVVNFLSYDADDALRMVDLFAGRTAPVRAHQLGLDLRQAGAAAARSPSRRRSPRTPRSSTRRRSCGRRRRCSARTARPASPSRSCGRPTPTTTRTRRCPAAGRSSTGSLRGEEIPVHGDGTSLWTLTHAEDFAQGLVGLLGQPAGDRRRLQHHRHRRLHLGPDLHHRRRGARRARRSSSMWRRRCIPLVAPEWFWSGEMVGDIGHSAIFDTDEDPDVRARFRPAPDLLARRRPHGGVARGAPRVHRRRRGDRRGAVPHRRRATTRPPRRSPPPATGRARDGARCPIARRSGAPGCAVGPICIGTSPLACMARLYGYEVSAGASRRDGRGGVRLADRLHRHLQRLRRATAPRSGGSAPRSRAAAGCPPGSCSPRRSTPTRATGDFSGDRVRASFEESLERLGVDRIELLHLHDPERIPFEEAVAPGGPVEALVRLRDEGLVGHLGVAGGPVGVMQRTSTPASSRWS